MGIESLKGLFSVLGSANLSTRRAEAGTDTPSESPRASCQPDHQALQNIIAPIGPFPGREGATGKTFFFGVKMSDGVPQIKDTEALVEKQLEKLTSDEKIKLQTLANKLRGKCTLSEAEVSELKALLGKMQTCEGGDCAE